MGFSLGGFIGGAADATATKMKSDRVDREAERSKVENMIYNTSGKLFANASLVEETRTKERKSNNKYMTELLSTAPSLQGDSARQAFILGLDEGAREDLLIMSHRLKDDKFNPEGRTFVDYLTAADDPIEYKDTTTLSEKVQGVVTPRPMDNSEYYGVSTTKDEEVDKIVDTYTSSFSVAYGMTAAKAQGLLDAAKQEVKVQSFNIDWAHKREMIAAEVAQVTAAVATAQLGTVKSQMAVLSSMENRATALLKKARDKYIASSGIPNEDTFNADKNNQASYLESSVYIAANKRIISDAVLYMESHPVLEESTMRFLNDNFPGKFGGEVGEDNPIESLKPNTYYVGTFTNGRGVATGAQIQAAKGITGVAGNEGFEDIKVNTKAETKDTTGQSPAAISTGNLDQSEIVRMNEELNTATGSYKKYLEAQLEGNPVVTPIKATPSEQADVAIEDLKNQGVRLEETGFDTWDKLKESMLEDKSEERTAGFGRRLLYVPDSMQLRTNETSMEIAIEEGDADKVQKILDNLQRMLDEDPSFDKKKKIGSVRGDGLRALKELLQGK